MKDNVSLLAGVSLFETIQPDELPSLLNCLQAQTKCFEKDSLIRNEGDPADFIGLVLCGTIQILHYDRNGRRNITAVFSAGDLFAEAVSCAEMQKLPFSIEAVTDCEILFLKEHRILHLCEESCTFHRRLVHNLLKIMAEKNVLLTQKLRYLSHKTTAEKLLSFLGDQAKLHHSNEFVIPFDRQALADYLGVERSAMSAEIGRLQKNGVLETKRNWFRLC